MILPEKHNNGWVQEKRKKEKITEAARQVEKRPPSRRVVICPTKQPRLARSAARLPPRFSADTPGPAASPRPPPGEPSLHHSRETAVPRRPPREISAGGVPSTACCRRADFSLSHFSLTFVMDSSWVLH